MPSKYDRQYELVWFPKNGQKEVGRTSLKNARSKEVCDHFRLKPADPHPFSFSVSPKDLPFISSFVSGNFKFDLTAYRYEVNTVISRYVVPASFGQIKAA